MDRADILEPLNGIPDHRIGYSIVAPNKDWLIPVMSSLPDEKARACIEYLANDFDWSVYAYQYGKKESGYNIAAASSALDTIVGLAGYSAEKGWIELSDILLRHKMSLKSTLMEMLFPEEGGGLSRN